MVQKHAEIEQNLPEETVAAATNTDAVQSAEQGAGKNSVNIPPQSDSPNPEETKMTQPTQVKKSGGKGIALLALLVALGVGGAGYFFGTQALNQINQQFANTQAQLKNAAQPANATAVEMPNLDAEKAQLTELANQYKVAQERIEQLSREQAVYTQQISQLQNQIQTIGNVPKADNTSWLLNEADFLLSAALHKLVLEADIATTKNLLIEADGVLSQLSNSSVQAVREAIKTDLNQLATVSEVDQNGLMIRLTQLANRVDDLPLASDETDDESLSSGEVSDSVNDWEKNLEKSASSFLDHFIRISDKNNGAQKELLAPNQEVYLRENLRLRLQIAIMAIPRQQNNLYQQSLDTVGTWVRSYFDEQNDSVKAFLKDLDSLTEQSIYVDAPKQLQSLTQLDQLLNKATQRVQKVEIEEEKSLEPAQATPAETAPASDTTPAQPAAQPENAQ